MKIQYLAVVFVIIMLPISLIFSAYTGAQVDTLKLQISYDIKLDNATYDAIKAFQLNTINSSTSDLTNSKIRDIEAAANSFFTSIGTAFNMSGYNSEVLKEYVPALVFTMYDGFYIYSPFENTLDDETAQNLSQNPNAEYTAGEKITGLKPYIFYSCRYVKSGIDVVITYSLDNYITIQGTANGKAINDAGYLIDDVSTSGSNVYYRGVRIEPEAQLYEYVEDQEEDKQYPYIKINGAKYYWDQEYDSGNGSWFYFMNGERMYGQDNFQLGNNDMAYRYYREAAEFKDRILNEYGLGSLTSADARDENGQPIANLTDADGNVVYNFVGGNYNIFDFNNGGVSIEEPTSDFNQHRLAVIRYVIERNLSIALANYNNYGSGSYEFSMPKLAEEDWERILNNVSLISFLQGLSIGGKVYNGYSVINNNKNEEVVTEDSIYITTNDGYFHRATERDLIGRSDIKMGVFNIDFERKGVTNNTQGQTHYYYPKRELGCYTCYVSQTSVQAIDNIYEYMDSNSQLAKIYYTALGRERYSMYKTFRNQEEHKSLFM